MITEFALLTTGYSIYKNWDKLNIHRKWKQITYSKSSFTNRLEKTLKILGIKRTEYGHIIKLELPYSYTFEALEKDLGVFKEGLRYSSIQLKNDGNIVHMYCVKKFQFNNYIPLQLPANKLLIAEGLTQPIIINMNKFPHMLIGGSTGTGKSRLLLVILTNLIKHCNDVEIYLLQLRKNDLGVFNNCKQVKMNSRTIEEVLETLKKIDKECRRRELLIDNIKGFYDIEDYNKVCYSKLKYMYVVIEEFSFLNISRGDSKGEKDLKAQCLKHIKTLVNVGRSSGIFLITALQKPTSDSIPSDIKDQLCTRVSLKITDEPPSIVILGNGSATKLQEREVIVRTLEEQKGYSYTIEHDMVRDNIKSKEIDKTKIVTLKPKRDIMEALNGINK